jgi:DnaK suppressor protein
VDDSRARELLRSARERIEASLADLAEPEDTDPAQSPADRATQLHDREVEEGLAERLRRIEEGTFGRSIESGESIPDARLEAIPWAERTAEEEQRRV